MEGKDNIKELFSQKLGNYEAKVNPELWANISTQVVAAGTTTATATGLSVFAKVAIGVGISAAAITTVVVLSTSSEEKETQQPLVERQTETVKTSQTETEKMAEVSDPSIIEVKERVNNNTEQQVASNTTMDSAESPSTTAVSSSSTSESTTASNKVDEDNSISTISTKRVSTVAKGGQSTPQIVEGITYSDVTNYGTKPVNEEEWAISEENAAAQNVEPIKRYVNVFTPNGDGRNDYFELQSKGLADFSVVVFDPSGDIVYQSGDTNFRWDGRDIRTGEIVKSGTYMYMVSAYDSEGKPYPIYERLTIMK